MLEVRDLCVSYGPGNKAAAIVEGLNFDVNAGEVLGIQGRSGCGKTSIALALLKLLPASARVSGTAFFRGKELLKLGDAQLCRIRGCEISITYQEPALALNPVLRVGEQISEVLRAHTALGKSERREQVCKVLNEVQLGSERYYRAYPHELSGGERHRIVLAQALVCRPALVIADEPTAGLDHALRNEILDLIDRLRHDTGAAFLLISHDRDITERLANRTIELSRTDEHKSPLAAIDRKEAKIAQNYALPEAGQLISVRNLSKRYKPHGILKDKLAEKQALQSVDLSIKRGYLTALVGHSGSGKSTLARCIALLETADSGEILVGGEDLTKLDETELRTLRPRFQYVFQDAAAALNPRLSAAEAIAEPLVIQKYGTREDRKNRVATLLEQTGLDPAVANRSCHEFSGGQKQRLVIARALALEPSLLIFDESLSGLDPETRDEILDLLVDLRSKMGITQLLISHDLELVSRVADSVAVMHNGKIVQQMDGANVSSLARVRPEQRLNACSQNHFAITEAK